MNPYHRLSSGTALRANAVLFSFCLAFTGGVWVSVDWLFRLPDAATRGLTSESEIAVAAIALTLWVRSKACAAYREEQRRDPQQMKDQCARREESGEESGEHIGEGDVGGHGWLVQLHIEASDWRWRDHAGPR